MNPNWYKACGKNIATFPFSPWKCKANIVISTLQKFLKWSENSVPKRSWGLFKLNRGSPVAAVAKGNPQSEAAHFDHLELWREAPPQASKKQKTFNSTLISCIWVCLRIGRLISFGSSSLVLFFNGLKWWASSSVFRHTHHLIMIGRLIIGFSQEAKLWHRTISQHKESVFHPLCCASGFRWEGPALCCVEFDRDSHGGSKRRVPWTRGSNRATTWSRHLATGCYSRKVTFERWVDLSFT